MQQDVQQDTFRGAAPPPLGANDIKVTLNGRRLQIAANVDLKGAKRLLKALQANMALLEDEDDAEIDVSDIA